MVKQIVGNWIYENGEIVADSNCKIIESMLKEELREIEVSEDGWTKRYQDENGNIWELTFPESNLLGGGPPQLTRIE